MSAIHAITAPNTVLGSPEALIPSGLTENQLNDAKQKISARVESSANGSPDSISISQEAIARSAQEQSVDANIAVETLDPAEADSLTWGPDLNTGWDDANFLKSVEGGYTGSLSFTSKYGHHVNVGAWNNEDGSPSDDMFITIQQTNGTTLRTKLEYSLRITEDEQGVSFAATNTGTDGDDIIISKGFGMTGGKGDDTLISLGLPGAKGIMTGDAGDDTLASLGEVGNGQLMATGSGRDTVRMRAYSAQSTRETGRHVLMLGEGDNQVIIDVMSKGAKIDQTFDHRFNNSSREPLPPSTNNFIIKELHGNMILRGENTNVLTTKIMTGSLRVNPSTSSSGDNIFTVDTLSKEGSINVVNKRSSNTFIIDELDGSITSGGTESSNTFTIDELNGEIFNQGTESSNTFTIDELNGKVRSRSTGQNNITVDSLNGELDCRDAYREYDGFKAIDKSSLDNTVQINNVYGKLYVSGSIQASVNSVSGGTAFLRGITGNNIKVGSLEKQGHLNVAGNLAPLQEVDGHLHHSNGTCHIEKSTGTLSFAHNSIATVGSHTGGLGVWNSAVTVGSLSGAVGGSGIRLDHNVDLTIGTMKDYDQVWAVSNAESIKMNIGTMSNTFMYLNSGTLDVNIGTMHRGGIAVGMLHNKDAQGTVHVDDAASSIFYGKGIDVTSSAGCIFTERLSVWRAVQLYGIESAISLMERFGGEGIFDETGLLNKYFIQLMAQ